MGRSQAESQAGQRRWRQQEREEQEGDETVFPDLPFHMPNTDHLKIASQHWPDEAQTVSPERIHMIAWKLVGVFNKSFFTELHYDLLPTDGADVVWQAPGGHPTGAVELLGEMHRAPLEKGAHAILWTQGSNCQALGPRVLTSSPLVYFFPQEWWYSWARVPGQKSTEPQNGPKAHC